MPPKKTAKNPKNPRQDKTKNLKPLGKNSKLSKEEQRAIQSKGGYATSEIRRKKRYISDLLRTCLEMELPKRQQEELVKKLPALKGQKIDYMTAVVLALIKTATTSGKHNARAFEIIRNTLGENPMLTIHNTFSDEEECTRKTHIQKMSDDELKEILNG